MKRARTFPRLPALLIKKLRPRKGDVLIVSAQRQLSMEEIVGVREALIGLGFEKAVICEGLTFTIARSR